MGLAVQETYVGVHGDLGAPHLLGRLEGNGGAEEGEEEDSEASHFNKV